MPFSDRSRISALIGSFCGNAVKISTTPCFATRVSMRWPEYSSLWRSAGNSGLAQRAHSSSRSIVRSSRWAAPQKMQRRAAKNSPVASCGWNSSSTVIYAPAMSRLRLYRIDAFTDARFGGNPAAVVPLERWLDDAVLQAVALENNLAETAYFVPEND